MALIESASLAVLPRQPDPKMTEVEAQGRSLRGGLCRVALCIC
jgi:hypothetical protein